MQQSSTTPKNQDVGIGLRKIVACSHSSSQCLLVSTVFGTVSFLALTVARGEIIITRTSLALASVPRPSPFVRIRTICKRIRVPHALRYRRVRERGRPGYAYASASLVPGMPGPPSSARIILTYDL